MFGFFKKRVEEKDFEQLKQAVQTGFNNVKQDVGSLTKWVKHLDSKDDELKTEISDVGDEITMIKEELENLKNIVSLIADAPLSKQRQTVFNKQTAVGSVLNTVQTAVQTVFLDNLTPNERAIIFVLLNSDMKLSYEDLAAMLGKNKSTIRGQINLIRQKNEGIIEEIIGENNKKRVYIPDNVREILLKTRKVSENSKKNKKIYKNSEM